MRRKPQGAISEVFLIPISTNLYLYLRHEENCYYR